MLLLTLMRRVLLILRSTKSIYTSHLTKDDPAFMFGHLDPANRFAMEGLNMAFAAELFRDEKSSQNYFH